MRKFLTSSILALALSAIPAMAQSHATIRDVQQALKDKGMDPGPVDGVNGPATKAAIKKYQDQQNLNEDGKLGPKTLDSLGVKESSSKTQFKASGENVKNSYSEGGSKVASGTKDAGTDLKHGEVGEGAVDFGKGVGKGVAKMGVGTGHAAKNVAKGVKNAVVPNDKKVTPDKQ
jgi:peptidoglycan hydrolase-like protein with peptidoglycan-binding domain